MYACVICLFASGSMWTGKEQVLRTMSLVIEKAPQCVQHLERADAQEKEPAGGGLMYVLLPSAAAGGEASSGLHLVLAAQDVSQGSPQTALQASSARLRRIYDSHSLSTQASQQKLAVSEQQGGQEEADCAAGVQFVPSVCLGWRLSWKGLLQVLLQEAGGRGAAGREYRVHISAALSGLPWTHFYSANDRGDRGSGSCVQQLRVWLQVCPPLLRSAGMAPGIALLVVEALLAAFLPENVESASKGAEGDWSSARSALNRERAALLAEVAASQDASLQVQAEVERASEEAARHEDQHAKASSRSKFNMFGGRYGEGGGGVASRTKRERGRGGAEALQEQEEGQQQQEEGQQQQEEGQQEAEEEGGPSAFRSSLDPAFRQHFLLTLSRCWPPARALQLGGEVGGVGEQREDEKEGVVDVSRSINQQQVWPELGQKLLPLLSGWLLGLMRTEVWSVRRASLLMQTALLEWLPPCALLAEEEVGEGGRTLALAQALQQNVRALALGAVEGKYSQVRVAAAQGLTRLLQLMCSNSSSSSSSSQLSSSPSPLSVSLSSTCQSLRMAPLLRAPVFSSLRVSLEGKIVEILRVLSADASPAVLTCHSQASGMWNTYISQCQWPQQQALRDRVHATRGTADGTVADI
jgi:hypothetical protein